MQQLPLSLDPRPICPRILLHGQTLCSSSSTKCSSKRLQPIRQRITPHRICTRHFPLLLPFQATSLTHNSGTTFRSWVTIGLTSVVNAIPAGENADQCFDHCSFAGVPPSGPRRTHLFPVATIFSHWFVCSGCKTCLFHCYLDQKQACSLSSPI